MTPRFWMEKDGSLWCEVEGTTDGLMRFDVFKLLEDAFARAIERARLLEPL